MSADDLPVEDGWQPAELESAKDYNNQRRVETIQDAYERVIIRRNDAQDHDPPDRQKIIFEAVKDYLFVTAELFFKEDEGPIFWIGDPDDPIHVVQPPGVPDDQAITIQGLRDYLFAEQPFRFTWTEETVDRVSGRQTNDRTVKLHMPEPASTKAYFYTNYFVQNVADLGLDLHSQGDPLSLGQRTPRYE